MASRPFRSGGRVGEARERLVPLPELSVLQHAREREVHREFRAGTVHVPYGELAVVIEHHPAREGQAEALEVELKKHSSLASQLTK